MLWFKRIFFLVFVIVVLLLALAFIDANTASVSLNLLVGEVSTTTGVALISGFIISLALMLIATWPVILSYRLRIKRLQKRLLKADIDTQSSKEIQV